MTTRKTLRPLVMIMMLVVLLMAALPAGAAPLAQGGIHVVQPGENLSSIAAYYGVSMSALAQANGISNANYIYVGQQLTIPGAYSDSTGSASSDGVHVVGYGENLSSIAAYYGTSTAALAQLNGISNPNQIYVGQRLAISGSAAAAPAATSSVPAASSSGGYGRWIDISLNQQTLTAYEGDTAVFSTLVSTGSTFPTPVGTYSILYKLPSQRMTGPGYDLPNVPWVMYFTNRGHAIHGAYWHNNFGYPMSHGCVNMRPDEAQWLYNFAANGTPVVVHY